MNIENMRRAKSSRTHSFKTFQFVSIHSLPTSFLFFAGILFRENLHEKHMEYFNAKNIVVKLPYDKMYIISKSDNFPNHYLKCEYFKYKQYK